MVQEGLLFYCWGLAEGKPEAAGGSSSSSHSLLENNMGERERGGEREGERGRGGERGTERGRGGGREEGKGSERERERDSSTLLFDVGLQPSWELYA